jgi:hypothetical protein
MGKVTGFLEIKREMMPRRTVGERMQDWFQVYHDPSDQLVQTQGLVAWTVASPSATRDVPWKQYP